MRTYVLPQKDKDGTIVGGIELIHISEFASIAHRSIPSTRRLIEEGNKIRKLKAYRDKSRLMIPVVELYGYPLINAGHSDFERNIYHYNEQGERVLCPECSYGNKCEKRRIADELELPEGDK